MSMFRSFLLWLLSGLGLTTILLGCAKEPLPAEPAACQQHSSAVRQAENEAWKSKAWGEFLQKIERGELKDPAGQYVSKSTYLNYQGTEPRPTRPKFNNQQRRPVVDADGVVFFLFPQCNSDDCGGSGGPPASTVTFVSTEGVAPYSGPENPDGYIYDLKLVSSASEQPAPAGYTKLATDLNDQAGGGYIHLTFTRNPGQVKNGQEYHMSKPYATGPVTGISIRTGGASAPTPQQNYFHIWWYLTNYSWAYWDALDLNNGAWGSHIWSYQTKQPGTPIEIGVLSGDNDLIQPPTGWLRLSTDLNQGAGGKFIYFCIKYR